MCFGKEKVSKNIFRFLVKHFLHICHWSLLYLRMLTAAKEQQSKFKWESRFAPGQFLIILQWRSAARFTYFIFEARKFHAAVKTNYIKWIVLDYFTAPRPYIHSRLLNVVVKARIYTAPADLIYCFWGSDVYNNLNYKIESAHTTDKSKSSISLCAFNV